MTSSCIQILRAVFAVKPFNHFKPAQLFVGIFLAILFTSSVVVRSEEAEDKFVRIYNIIEKADSLAKKGQTEQAKAKYEQAQAELRDLKSINPTWNAKAVSYRLSYVADQIAGLSQPPAVSTTEIAGSAKSGPKSEDKAGNSPANVHVKLLSAGSEPRQVLRLHPKPGDKQTLAITIKLAMEMQMGEGAGQPMKMPAMTMILDATVKDVASNGDIAFETVLSEASVSDEPGVMPQVAEAMKTALDGAKGITTAGKVSNRGMNKGSEMKMPAGAATQMQQSLEQLKESLANATVPLPEEAIGAGAKWEVKLPTKSQGLIIDQTATYELVSAEGDRLNLKSNIGQKAANQKIQSPAMPAMTVDVTKMTGSGSGDCKLELTQLLPSLATVAVQTELAMGMNLGGQKQVMTMKTEMNIRLESK